MWGAVLPEYAELYCLTNFSFLHGASHAQELVARAVQLGYHALAITDECSLAGAPGFVSSTCAAASVACRHSGLRVCG